MAAYAGSAMLWAAGFVFAKGHVTHPSPNRTTYTPTTVSVSAS